MSLSELETIFRKAEEDVESLAQLLAIGRQQGFQNYLNRKTIWPFLLRVDRGHRDTGPFAWEEGQGRECPDYEQLQKDAERALGTMKTFDEITKFHLQKRQKDVLHILKSFFSHHQELKYIQGFHDVASVFIVLFGNNQGYYLLQQAGSTYFRDFLTQDIGPLSSLVSQLVLALLQRQDPDFLVIFKQFEESGQIVFILPWVLTWFSHVLSSVKTICRTWDYILCTGPHGIVFITAGIILSTKQELCEQCPELDLPSIQTFYQERAKNDSFDIENSIAHALRLEQKTALEQLSPFQQLPAESMFRRNNFELHIDYHRRVQEHQRTRQLQRRRILIAWGLLSALALLLALSYHSLT